MAQVNMLLDRPPDSVEVNGATIPINTDFRAGVRFELLIASGCEDVYELLRCFYAELPDDIPGALRAAVRFYALGKDYEAEEQTGKKAAPCYSFAQDAAEIFASFRAAYGIDLSTESMHWWIFRTLMTQLPEDTEFKKLVQIRTADTSDMGDKQRKHVEKLKRIYALGETTQRHETLEARNLRWMKAGR